MVQRKNDILQGTLELLVLRTLAAHPGMHGYAITAHIQRVSEDLLRVEEGSLYPALHRMEQEGRLGSAWGTTEKNREARFYSLTAAGKAPARARGGRAGPGSPKAWGGCCRAPDRRTVVTEDHTWPGFIASSTWRGPPASPATSTAKSPSTSPSGWTSWWRAGMGEGEARREARAASAIPSVQRERTRDVDIMVWLESVLADLRYAARGLAQPGVRAGRDPLARPRHRRQHRHLQPDQRRGPAPAAGPPPRGAGADPPGRERRHLHQPAVGSVPRSPALLLRRLHRQRASVQPRRGGRSAAGERRLGERRLLRTSSACRRRSGACSGRRTTSAAVRRWPS